MARFRDGIQSQPWVLRVDVYATSDVCRHAAVAERAGSRVSGLRVGITGTSIRTERE